MTKTTLSQGGRRSRMALLAALLAFLFPIVGPADPAAAACSLTPGDWQIEIPVDAPGTAADERVYHLHVPAGITDPAMLVVALHPGAISATDWEAHSGWVPLAASEGFVVAFPQGWTWNTWDANNPDGVDFPFLTTMIDDIKARVCIDDDRVHASGYSMGGQMSQRLACQEADVFASIGAGGTGHPELHDDWWPWYAPWLNNEWDCTPSRPIAVHLSIGSLDNTTVGQEARHEWLGDNSCGATPPVVTVPVGTKQTWSCAAGTQVVWRTYTGENHTDAANWGTTPVGPYLTHGVAEEYAFFLAHPRP